MISKRAALPLAVAVMLAVSAWIDWWTYTDTSTGRELFLRVSLHGARACSEVRCLDLPMPGTWAFVGLAVLLVVVATSVGYAIAVAHVVTSRDPDPILAIATKGSAAVAVALVVAFADFTIQYGGTPSWGLALAGAGAVLGLVAKVARAVDDGFGASASSAPVRVRGRLDQPPTPPTAPPRSRRGPTASLAALRFVATSGSIAADGLTVELGGGGGGGVRVLAWRDLAQVAVRRLPPDPPFDKAALIDLVPERGAPIRLLATSRLDYASLPGGAAPGVKENWRRLVALAQAANPAIEIETESVVFFAGGEPPMFAAIKLFDAYDRRYG